MPWAQVWAKVLVTAGMQPRAAFWSKQHQSRLGKAQEG